MTNNSNLEKMRYERKMTTTLPLEQVINLVKTHPSFFQEQYPQRQVNNLYFDTEKHTFFHESVNGHPSRKKVRLRWYGNYYDRSQLPQLEIKRKQALLGAKEMYFLTNNLTHLDNPSHSHSQITHDSAIPETLRRVLARLQPTVYNHYQRLYFLSLDKSVRLTIDFDIFYKSVNCTNAKKSDREIIIELKYTPEAETIATRITQDIPFRIIQKSKYTSGVQLLHFGKILL